MKRIAPIFVLLLLSCVLAQAQTRAFSPADTLRIANVADAQISPDGKFVAYTVSTVEGNENRARLWLVATERNARPALLLPEDWTGSAPRWSRDSKRLAFQARRDRQSGLWIMDLAARQPQFVAEVKSTNHHIPYAGESFAWSPDGKALAYIHATPVKPDEPAPDTDPRVIDRIQYKSRTSFTDHLRPHVWLVNVDPSSPKRGETRQLTEGVYYDHALTWNPDGKEIAFLSNHEPDPDANNNSDIFAVNLNGNTRQITHTKGCEYEPRWSPDGKLIAYTATARPTTTIDSVAEDTHVWVIEANATGGQGRDLTAKQDRRARSPRWSPDSSAIYFSAGEKGQTLAFFVSLAEGTIREMFSDKWSGNGLIDAPGGPPNLERPFQLSSCNFARNQSVTVACVVSNATEAGEVWFGNIVNYHGSSRLVARLTEHNSSLLRGANLSDPLAFYVRSFDNAEIQGWLMKPVGWEAGKKYPLILSVHGGPHGSYGYGFNAAFQAYAARGYAVLFINPRGSSGYGQRFSDGTLREWGGGDYKDLMAGVDEALRRYSWIDADKMGVTGGSYGGFMTNWIITQTPRFRAAVASASVSNLISFYSTSLYQDLIHAEFGGFPWDDYDLLWRWSPLRYVKNVQTPTLFIHGELDNDVHITQAEEMYTALRQRGVPAVLVRYPREGHGLREPKHRLDALERTLAWFDKYLK
jgi:dipeptidyl aminopeptidase/acylaminoacyl peptidase